MAQRRKNAEEIGYIEQEEEDRKEAYKAGDLNRFPPYFGSHPKVMKEKVEEHILSQQDLKDITKRFWWHPARILKLRHKTSKRVKEKIV